MSRLVVLSLAFAGAFLATKPAAAFERQWHLGGGVGAADLSASGVGWGPEFGLHAAYGLTDTFDVRLEGRLLSSPFLLEAMNGAPAVSDRLTFFAADLGLAYKIDIIQWVPWLSAQVGYFGAAEPPPLATDLEQNDFQLGGSAGLDYAYNRSFGLGVVWRVGFLGSGETYTGGQLRVEYRWGW